MLPLLGQLWLIFGKKRDINIFIRQKKSIVIDILCRFTLTKFVEYNLFIIIFLQKNLRNRSKTGFLTGACWFQDCLARKNHILNILELYCSPCKQAGRACFTSFRATPKGDARKNVFVANEIRCVFIYKRHFYSFYPLRKNLIKISRRRL